MSSPNRAQSLSLETAFFRKRDAELIAEIRQREIGQNRKKTLAEVSGIKDQSLLDELVAHDIHAETLAAFSLVPIIEVAWADGTIQPGERDILLEAISEAGIPRDGIAFQLMESWLDERPTPKLMKLWSNYTKALMNVLPPEAAERIRRTVLTRARSVAEAAGGFLGFGRVSKAEEKMLQSLEAAFEARNG
jgi:hypothetical protein